MSIERSTAQLRESGGARHVAVLDPPWAPPAPRHGRAAGPDKPARPAIEVEGASKVFGAKRALDTVDLAVPAGAFCVLLGPSGSGKTTLLRCIAGIERLTAGRLTIGGRLVADGGVHVPPHRRELSMVFQDYALWPHLTARRNVEFALQRRRLRRREASERAREVLDRVGLAHLADRYPNELSGGEQQRVALARALAARTEVLLFDEPLSNLDADRREQLRIEIGTLARDGGATSVYITHDQAEAFALADLIGVLRDGRIVQLGRPEDIYHRPLTPFVARFTGLAGELPVGVVAATRGTADMSARCTVRLAAGGAAPARTAAVGTATRPILATPARDSRVDAASGATMLVRPAAVRMLPAGDEERHVDGVVLDTAYRGRGYDHVLAVGNTGRLVGVHDHRRWARGDRVGVRLDAAGCLVFPDDTPGLRADGPVADVSPAEGETEAAADLSEQSG